MPGKARVKPTKTYEAVIELNHKFVQNRGFSITLDLQYIIRQAGTGDTDDALVTGARIAVEF